MQDVPLIKNYALMRVLAIKGANQYLEKKHSKKGRFRAQRLLDFFNSENISEKDILTIFLAIFEEPQFYKFGRSSLLAGLIADLLITGTHVFNSTGYNSDTLNSDVFNVDALKKIASEKSTYITHTNKVVAASSYFDNTKCVRYLLQEILKQYLTQEQLNIQREACLKRSMFTMPSSPFLTLLFDSSKMHQTCVSFPISERCPDRSWSGKPPL